MKVETLVKRLKEASAAYYNADSPIMTDIEYDALVEELKKTDPNNDFLKTIGAPPTSTFVKVPHTIPMGSLDKCGNETQYIKWHKKHGKPVCIMNKLDGCSLEVIYTAGTFTQAISRGNGIIGEDVTENARRFKNLPLSLNREGDSFPATLSVRGEVLLSKADWKTYFPDTANPRNAANGTLRRQSGEGCERLQFIAYDSTNPGETSHTKKLDRLSLWGFTVVDHFPPVSTPEKAAHVYTTLITPTRATSRFEIDGVVFRIDDEKTFREMGEHNGRPKGATVLKFEADRGVTKLESVELTVGHTGAIIPVGKLKPVPVGGVTISSVLLNNFEEIERLGIAVGDSVHVIRAGDVIPKVIGVAKKAKNRVAIPVPVKCPSCSSLLVKDGVHIFCKNEDCEAREDRLLRTWIDKRNIKFIGDTQRGILYRAGLTKPHCLYEICEKALRELLGEGNARRIMVEIEKSKTCPLHEFIGSLGIKFLGRRQASILIEAGIDTLQKFEELTEEQCKRITGFSGIKASAIVPGIVSKCKEISDLLDNGVKISYLKKETEVAKKKTLEGKSFCFTGAIEKMDPTGNRYTREKMTQLVLSTGGSVSDTVTAMTTYLVQADPNSQSSKSQKAKKAGVTILSEKDFFKMVEETT